MFRKRLVVLHENLEKLEKLHMPPETAATGLLCLLIEIRLYIYYYYIPQKHIIEVTVPCLNILWLSTDCTLDFADIQNKTDLEYNTDLESSIMYNPNLEIEDYILLTLS
jgi:hypothetical protein